MSLQAVATQPKSQGRPPKPPEQRRSEILRVRLTPEEADSVYRYAIEHGRSVDAVLRAVLRVALFRGKKTDA